ncbi:hypothetical protein SLS56_003710 [Neofusicoccum ribis]|uniref:FAD dependent oxidoreductase domain-containing protein n=1 Tax=Neofusicoccum ribis TaxID=45134 RepID=A0ABR3SY85_9PEZI
MHHNVCVFDQNKYDETGYQPEVDDRIQAACEQLSEAREESREDLFVDCGMLRVQPTDELGALERETLANMERAGLRDTQFVKSYLADRAPAHKTYEAVLDSLAGFTRCSDACAHFQKMAAAKGVVFKFGPQEGAFDSLVEEKLPKSATLKRVIGLKTKDGIMHKADVTVVAAGSFSTQLLPELSYHLESSSGSVATLKIDIGNVNLSGKDTGSVYAFPRTAEGLIKIGYRGIKFTNFQPAPPGTPFTQDNQWSVPLAPNDSKALPQPAVDAIRDFISIFLPEFKDAPFHSTKLCWYTDSLDNSFVHTADIFENGDGSSSYMRRFWRWRDETPRGNGLEEGPAGPRNIGGARKFDQ